MKVNPNPIEINPKIPKHCMGFVDALGQELKPGDEIIVHNYRAVYHAVIIRFTNRRIYWTILRSDDSMHDACFHWYNFSQLHQWYSTASNGSGNMSPEDPRRLRTVIKFEDTTTPEVNEL